MITNSVLSSFNFNMNITIHAFISAMSLCSMVDKLFSLGRFVGYDRLLQMTNNDMADMANGVLERFELEQVVCPPKLSQCLFTTGAVDNIDYNSS